jgi:hypothetical protein
MMHVAEQKSDAKAVPNERKQCETCKKEETTEPDMDEFEKKWADIEYLIRKPFCCK